MTFNDVSCLPPRSERPIAIFLHVATMGRYSLVFNEVLVAIRDAGMLDLCAFVEVNVIGTGPIQLEVEHPAIRVVRRSEDVRQFEYPTLEAMHAYSRDNRTARVLYCNCLGGRYIGDGWDIRNRWRRLLYYLFLQHHEKCLALLDQNDVVVVEWGVLPLPHATSNNWWANASYLALLPRPSEAADQVELIDLSKLSPYWNEPANKRRHAGEFWLGLSKHVRPYQFLKLSRYGFRRSDLGSIPWWDLPGVDWRTLAERELGERPFGWFDVALRLTALRDRWRRNLRGLRGLSRRARDAARATIRPR